jgi:dTDP-4-dehydrorhamnose 3,5-epimerase
VAYKVDAFIWDDPDVGIDWPIPTTEAVLFEKDTELSRLAEFQSPFIYSEKK